MIFEVKQEEWPPTERMARNGMEGLCFTSVKGLAWGGGVSRGLFSLRSNPPLEEIVVHSHAKWNERPLLLR
jgi:hypothetical protein